MPVQIPVYWVICYICDGKFFNALADLQCETTANVKNIYIISYVAGWKKVGQDVTDSDVFFQLLPLRVATAARPSTSSFTMNLLCVCFLFFSIF